MHTCEEDFQHFLSYSGLRSEPPDVIEKLRKAYEAAWEPSPPKAPPLIVTQHVPEHCPKCGREIGIDMSGCGYWYSHEAKCCNECIRSGERKYVLFVCAVCAVLLIVMAFATPR